MDDTIADADLASINEEFGVDSATATLEHVQVLIDRLQLCRLPLGNYRTTSEPAYPHGLELGVGQ